MLYILCPQGCVGLINVRILSGRGEFLGKSKNELRIWGLRQKYCVIFHLVDQK
jgi:hypothetical protein